MSVSQLIDEAKAKEIIANVDHFLFDCDGVLWDGNGVIEGSVETIIKLKNLGKNVYYITNNSSKSRKEYLEKCKELGYPAELDDIVCTAYAAAQYLKSIEFKNKVYLVGKDESMGVELKDAGIKYFGPGPYPLEGNLKEWLSMKLDPEPDALIGNSYEEWLKNTVLDKEVTGVVVGFDPHISYMKIMKAASYLGNPNCIYVATNEDRSLPAKDNDICIPGTGCMVLPVSLAANRKPILLGKPETNMFDLLKKVRNIDPSRCMMTGDRYNVQQQAQTNEEKNKGINTDIVFAKKCGVCSMLVLSGISTEDDLITPNKKGCNADTSKQPDVYVPKLADFGKFI